MKKRLFLLNKPQKKEMNSNIKSKINLNINEPYLNNKSISPFIEEIINQFKDKLNNNNAVSFDIFDTLIIRYIDDPEYVFDLVKIAISKNQSILYDFVKERKIASGKALNSFNGSIDDVTIDEIYKYIPFIKDPSFEKKIELYISRPHPIGKILYDIAYKDNKKIYITSDMYLDKKTIENILKKCGYYYWDNLFLSSDKGNKKLTGKLYIDVKEFASSQDIQSNKILHVGDNLEGDIIKAKENGLNTFKLPFLDDIFPPIISISKDQKNKFSLQGKLWSSICNKLNSLYECISLKNDFNILKKIGFSVTGPLSIMMSLFVAQQAKKLGISNIIFLARDGHIIKKAFESIYDEEINNNIFKTDYAYLSRSTVIPATLSNPLTSSDIFFIIEGISFEKNTLSYYLKKAGIDCKDKKIAEHIKNFSLKDNQIIGSKDIEKISSLLISLSEDIYKANELNRKNLYYYLKSKGFFNQKTIIVDVGWFLNIHSRISKFIKKISNSENIFGCYFGSFDGADKEIKTYSLFFNYGEPIEISNFMKENIALFELLFSAPEEPASHFTFKNNNILIIKKEIDNVDKNEINTSLQIHKGAEDFFQYISNIKNLIKEINYSKDFSLQLFKELFFTNNQQILKQLGIKDLKCGGMHDIIDKIKLLYFHKQSNQKQLQNQPLAIQSIKGDLFQIKIDRFFYIGNNIIIGGWSSHTCKLIFDNTFNFRDQYFFHIKREDVSLHLGNKNISYGFSLIINTDYYSDSLDIKIIVPELKIEYSSKIYEDVFTKNDFDKNQAIFGNSLCLVAQKYFHNSKKDFINIIEYLPILKNDTKEVLGHLEKAIKIQNTNYIVIMGWYSCEKETPIWAEDNLNNKFYIEESFRYWREDAFNFVNNKFEDNTSNYGFIHKIKNEKTPEHITLKYLSRYGICTLNTIQIENRNNSHKEIINFLFSVQIPIREFSSLVNEVYQDIIEELLINYSLVLKKITPYIQELGKQITNPDVSIIIPLYGRYDFVEHQLIEFSKDIWLKSHCEVIYVIDDPKIYNLFSIQAESLYKLYNFPFKWVWGHKNRGFSGANNLGASIARSKVYIFMNSDIIPSKKGWIEPLFNLLTKDSKIGLISPRLLHPDGSIQHSWIKFIYRDEFKIWTNRIPYAGCNPKLDIYKEATIVECVAGACIMISKEVFEKVNGWDDGYLIGDYEDSDMCLKLREKGFFIIYLPIVELFHLERQSFSMLNNDMIRQRISIYNAVRHQNKWKHLIEKPFEKRKYEIE